MKTRVVNKYKEGYTLYIGRPSIWGNPFPLASEADRKACLIKYATWLQTQQELLSKIHTLKGQILGCFCHPKMCHGHVLARLADSEHSPQEELKIILHELCDESRNTED